MQRSWGHLGYAGLVALAGLMRESEASYEDEYEVHWMRKDHNVFRHPKRDSSCQLSDWHLCPASAGGGCCPDNYECGSASCFATTAGPSTACGRDGYFNCPITAGAGSCCPVGFVCGSGDQCLPPSGPYSQSCPASYFACPSSLGYGCCQNGLICGSGACYESTPTTQPVSFPLTTTNSNGMTITTTTTSMMVITPGPDLPSSTAAAVGVPKLVPSTVSKMLAIETDSSDDSNSGLSTGALGGIIAGAIVLLIVIVVATVLIIRRLRRTEKAAQAAAESRRDSSSRQPTNSHKSGFEQPSISEVDGGVDTDPLRRTRLSPHMRSQSDPSMENRSASRIPKFNVSSGGEDSSRTSTPPTWGAVAYNTGMPSDTSDGRQSSLDTCANGYHSDNNDAHNNNNNPRYSQQTAQRVSYESQGSSYFGRRHWSNASEMAGSLFGAHGVSELDSLDPHEAASRRRSNSSNATARPIAAAHVRHSSDPTTTTTRARGDSSSAAAGAPVAAQPPLGTVTEVPLPADLHGHYGPPDIAVGQTDVKLRKGLDSASTKPEDSSA